MGRHLKVLLSGSLCLCDQLGHTGEGRKAPYAQALCSGCMCYSMAEVHCSFSFLKTGDRFINVHVSEVLQLVRLPGSFMAYLLKLMGLPRVTQNLIGLRYLQSSWSNNSEP